MVLLLPTARCIGVQDTRAQEAARQTTCFMHSTPMGDNMIYVVTYMDVRAQFIAQARTLVERYQDASRNDAGNAGIDVLEETARPNRFVVIGIWQDATFF